MTIKRILNRTTEQQRIGRVNDMASISTDRNGCRRILFATAYGERRTIYLGKMSMKAGKRYQGEDGNALKPKSPVRLPRATMNPNG